MQQFDIFMTKFNEAKNKYIPHINTKASKKAKKHNYIPLDTKTIQKIKKKHRCWTRYRETGDKNQEYAKTRNQVKSAIRKAKANMEKEIAKNAKSNPMIFWKYANSKRKINTGISELKFKSEEGEERKTTTDKEKAEVLASIFSSVFTIEPEGDLPLMHPIDVKQECIQKTFNESEILKLLQNLDVNKSCGPDGLHTKMLKELSATISKPITIIFNSYMCQGLVPQLWKEGDITALLKKGDKAEPGNYRPVSLTSVICKTMEKLVREIISKHMSANKLFSNKQFGFISGRSTTLQLLQVMDE